MRTCQQVFSLESTGGCPNLLATWTPTGFVWLASKALDTTSLLFPRLLLVGRFADIVFIDRDTQIEPATVANSVALPANFIGYSPTSEYAWATCSGIGTPFVQVIDCNSFLSLIERDNGPGLADFTDPAFRPAANEMLFLQGTTVVRYNAATTALVAIHPLWGPGIVPSGMDCNTLSNRIVIGVIYPGPVYVVESYNAAFALADSWATPRQPFRLVWAADTDKVFVLGQTGANWFVDIFDSGGALTTTIALPLGAVGISLTYVPTRGYVAVNYQSAPNYWISFINTTTEVIDCTRNAASDNIPVITADPAGRTYAPLIGAGVEVYG